MGALSSPNLGVIDWLRCEQPFLLRTAEMRPSMVPPTLRELIGADEKRLLNEMATSKIYLDALAQFERRLLYGNAVNDHRVSCASALILPMFGRDNAQRILEQRYFARNIEKSTQRRESIVTEIGDAELRRMQSEHSDSSDSVWWS